MLTGEVAGCPSRAACQNDRESTQGGGHPGRTVRCRRPRWRPGRVRRRALWRVDGSAHRDRRGAARRGHVPPSRLHPRQGAAPDGRGAAHRGRGQGVRCRRGPAHARSRCEPGPEAEGHRPTDQGPRGSPEGTKGHGRPGHGLDRRRRRPPHPGVGRVRAHRQRPRPRHRLGAPFAARPRLRRAADPVLRPRARARRRPAPGDDHRRGCDRVRVRVAVERSRQRGHARGGAASHPAGRRHRGGRHRGAVVPQARREAAHLGARHQHRRRARAHGALRHRRRRPVRRRRQGGRERRPAAALGGHRPRGIGRRGRRPGLRRRRRADAHDRPRGLRGR